MSKFKRLDNHVIKAWHTKKFSDGSKIRLGRTNYEHAFVVRSDGIFEIEVNERGKYRCRQNGITTKGPYTSILPSSFGTHAGGHTHPLGKSKDISPFPGPGDNSFAKATYLNGKISYVIANAGSYAIEYDGSNYRIRTLSGLTISESKTKAIIEGWNKSPVSKSNRNCVFIPNRKYR